MGRETWNRIAAEMCERSLAPSTIKSYELGFQRAAWPLDTPYKVMEYLDRAPTSDSGLKQWIATANKIHKVRRWEMPPFNDPTVEVFIDTLKRRPSTRKTDPTITPVFTEQELTEIFKLLAKNEFPTDLRNWSIFVVQLFGARRASEVLGLHARDVKISKGSVLIKIGKSKTDRRGDGVFFKIPQQSCFGFDPNELILRHILSLGTTGGWIFPAYDHDIKQFTTETITVGGWNQALKRLCMRTNIPVRTSHAIRRSAITLTPIDLVEAVAQTGGWKSLCFWEVYRRFNLDERATACSKIGTRNAQKNEYKTLFL